MGQTAVALFGFLLICATSGQTEKEKDVDIYSFHINSTVTSRYAITVITSRVANRVSKSEEVHFHVKIPKNAFISKFRMTIEEKMYDGVVKKKEEAQEQYSQAVSRGESAGMVSSVGRTLEEFKTSVTVAAYSKVTFELTYEELLMRRHGKYQLQINSRPMQPVADFKIDVYIHENPGISFLEVKGGLTTKELANAVTTTRSDQEVWVNFYPTRRQQTMCDVCGKDGMDGDLLIVYDVERTRFSELKASDGYFVHYFAPTDVQRIPKNVVFVIDRSGSMSGRKIEQTHAALLKILGDLAEDDHFGLITFHHDVEVWNPELPQATKKNLKAAKDFVKNIQVGGSTNINSGVLKGVEMIKNNPREGSASILILLTDGQANSGESDPEKIQANVRNAIGGKFPLYCLGFGFDVNFDSLKKMSLENNGVARRIYEDSDADLQLQGFYEEVATPLLTDVQMNYTGTANLTQTNFRHYYNGSEIVVAGKVADNSLENLKVEIVAISKNNNVTYQDSVFTKELVRGSSKHEHFIQRLWAFLTMKQLLEKEMTLNGLEKEAARKEALDLSLTYKFVTPLTSMVVTKPHGEDTQVAHKPKEERKERHSQISFRAAASPRKPNLLKKGTSQSRGAGGSRQSLHDLHNLHTSLFSLQEKPSGEKVSRGFMTSSSRMVLTTTPSPVKRQRISATLVAPATFPSSVSTVRFLISARHKKPLCYDLPAPSKLCVLSDPSSDFFMNGELSSKGFKQIVIRYETNHYLMLNTSHIHYHDGLNSVMFLWGQEPTNHKTKTESVDLILREEEMDVSMGRVRMLFFRHKKDGEMFLWPSVKQQPSSPNIGGIFGKNRLHYEESSESRIKIKDKEETATWSTAIDYRRSLAPVLGCWLLPFQFVLQGDFSDFTVSQL